MPSSFQSLLSQFKQTAAHQKKRSACESASTEASSTSDVPSKKRQKPTSVSPAAVHRVILLCPANTTTGGPEAIHQLCGMFQTQNEKCPLNSIPATILYCEEIQSFDSSTELDLQVASQASIPTIYTGYNPQVLSWNPNETLKATDLVIFPELWTQYLDSFAPAAKAQKGIWWLSVDNNRGKYLSWMKKSTGVNCLRHFCQSAYAKDYLLKHDNSLLSESSSSKLNNKSHRLFDLHEYIPKNRFILEDGVYSFPEEDNGGNRCIDVVYNPVKGKFYTDEIIRQATRCKSELKFRAIEGNDGKKRLTPREVTDLLRQSKVYIDFGNHPGMDRIPREAALAGCIVITNHEGAAGFQSDVPINSKYKIEEFDAYKIVSLLEKSVKDYSGCRKDFDSYRKTIGQQYENMGSQVRDIMSQLTSK